MPLKGFVCSILLEVTMTQFATITINDGQATPVAHTFTARRLQEGIAKWQDISGGIAVGFPTITASLREPVRGSKSPNYKATIKVALPVLEVVNSSTYSGITPAPTKAYDVVASLDIIMPERSALQNRKDIRAYLANLLANADIKAMVEDLNMVY